MENYTIYCSREQTLKAIKLGAPIDQSSVCHEGFDIIDYNEDHSPKLYAITPTAEQMCGWLEFQGILVLIDPSQNNFYGAYSLRKKDGRWLNRIYLDGLYPSRKEATIAAIDDALDYLEKKGNNEPVYN